MAYYLYHRNGLPISINSFRLRDSDIELDTALALDFLSTERVLGEYKVTEVGLVKATEEITLGNRSIIPLRYTSAQDTQSGIVVSPNEALGLVEFFTDGETIHAIQDKVFSFLVDGVPYEIDLMDFVEGQYSLSVPLTKRSRFSMEEIVTPISLCRDYGQTLYRRRNLVRRIRQRADGQLDIERQVDEVVYVTDRYNPNLVLTTLDSQAKLFYQSDKAFYLSGVELRGA